MPQSVAVLGTLDTKGEQIDYLRRRIEHHGQRALVIDVGVLGKVPFTPEISREQVAAATGSSLSDVAALHDHFLSMTRMAQGASILINDLCSKDRLSGIIAVGGSQGTALALAAMKYVPLGMPKILITTVAYSQLIVPDMISGNDVMMIPWTAGLWGLNSMSRRVMETAAAAIAGAAGMYASRAEAAKKIAGVTSLGSKVNTYMSRLKPALETRGYEVAVFHVTGMSGRLFERAISDGLIQCSLDLSVGVELLNSVADGACSAGPQRLEAACRLGIPQIVSPGAIEAFHWGKDRPLPARYVDRPCHQHNALILTVSSSLEEMAATGKLMAEKLDRATGPTAVVLPMKGMSGRDIVGETPDHARLPTDYADFVVALRKLTIPGMEAFREGLMKDLRPDIPVVTLDAGFNEPPYTDAVLKLFDAQTSGR